MTILDQLKRLIQLRMDNKYGPEETSPDLDDIGTRSIDSVRSGQTLLAVAPSGGNASNRPALPPIYNISDAIAVLTAIENDTLANWYETPSVANDDGGDEQGGLG